MRLECAVARFASHATRAHVATLRSLSAQQAMVYLTLVVSPTCLFPPSLHALEHVSLG